MRIRSTKPEFWRSKTIAQLDWDVRFVLKGLESYVDDNGVGKDDLELIAADVFPRDMSRNPRDTIARLSEAVHTLHKVGLIARYEACEESLIYIDRWKDLQRIDRPSKGRFPRPDGTMEYNQEVDRESYRNPRDTPLTGTGEQGNRGTEDQESSTPVSTDVALVGGSGGKAPAKAVAATKGKKGTRLPVGWVPSQKCIEEQRQRYPQIDLRLEHEKFTNYWNAQPGAKGVKLDWEATWRNWVINASERSAVTRGRNNDDKIRELMEMDVHAEGE